LDGKILETNEVFGQVAPFVVTPVCQLDFSKLLDDDLIRQVVFVAELWQAGKMQARLKAFSCQPSILI
jgi:hypothetical protein